MDRQRERDRQIDRQMDRQRERDGQIDRERWIDRDRETDVRCFNWFSLKHAWGEVLPRKQRFMN